MRWLFRLLTLLVFLILVRAFIVPQSQAFISWPEEQTWVCKVQGQMKYIQTLAQDLPTSIEVEVRRLLKDFRTIGNAQEI